MALELNQELQNTLNMLFEDTYLTIEKKSEGEYKDKGSKFLAYAFPIKKETEVKEFLAELRKMHHGARHHCYAFVLGANKLSYRANDDGEPSYTAGKPILGQIQSKDLTNILIVVVRYFGGTLLGVSGLINAYKTAANEAIKNNEIIEKTINEVYEINFEYTLLNEVLKTLKEQKATITSQVFENNCEISFSVRRKNSLMIENTLKKITGISIKYLKTE